MTSALLSIEALADAGGGTAVFAQTAGFGAVFLLAVFIATVAGELTRGTFRTMLLQQPARGRVLAGKLAAIIGFTAVLALVAEADRLGDRPHHGSRAGHRRRPVDDHGRPRRRPSRTTAGWSSSSPAGPSMATVIGVLARSVPIGVGIGLVWAGPIENIIGDGWTPGQQFFPGLVLRALINPASAEISTTRAMVTLAAYGGDRRHDQRHRPEATRRHRLNDPQPRSVRRDRITTCDSYGQIRARSEVEDLSEVRVVEALVALQAGPRLLRRDAL